MKINSIFYPSIHLSICALFVLSASACSSNKSEPHKTDHSLENKSSSATDKTLLDKEIVKEMLFSGPGSLLAKDIGDFNISSAPRYFDSSNLYDLINGGAEIFVQFGLENMVTADYQNKTEKDKTITIEIYDMGSFLNAFGRTAKYLESQQDPSLAGESLPDTMKKHGIFGDGDLIIWKDKYLVHLTLLDQSATATQQSIAKAGKKYLPSIAKIILDKVKDNPALPDTFAKFPKENKIARSEAWHPAKLIGIDGLSSGYTVRYKDNLDHQWLAFATTEFKTEDEAEKMWSIIKSTAAENRQVAIKISGKRVVGLIQDGEKELDVKLITNNVQQLKDGFL